MFFRGLRACAFLSILALLTFSPGCKDKPDRASQDLIDAFASGCSSNGFWTQSALTHTNNLIGVLENIKKNDACRPFGATLASIQTLQSQMGFLLTNTSYKDFRGAEESLTELNTALSALPPGSNPDLEEALKQALVEAQVNRALAKGRSSVDSFDNATAQLASVMQSLTLQARDLSLCLQQSPGAAVQLATNALAVGGSFITPVLGLGVASVGQLFNGAIEYVRSRGTNKAIWQLYSAKMPMALTCGLEAMTQLYCQANDAFDLVQFQRSNYTKPGSLPNEIWEGMDILGRRLPVLNKWILKLKAGVPPTDQDEAQKVTRIWRKIHTIDIVDIAFRAELTNLVTLHGSTDNKATKDKLLTDFLVKSSGKLSNTCSFSTPQGSVDCGSGPFAEYQPDDYLWGCWLVFGKAGADPTKCPKKDLQKESLQYYIESYLTPRAEIAAFENNWSELLTAVSSFVDVEFSQKITLSAQSVLDQAFYPRYNSPREVLGIIRNFLQRGVLTQTNANPHRGPLVQGTLATVNDVIAILDNPDPNYLPMKRVLDLFKKLDLTKSARRFAEDLNGIIANDIEGRLRDGELPSDVSEILRAAGIDIRERLKASGVTRLGDVVDDLNNARNITQRNIEIFRDYFSESFARAIKDLYRLTQGRAETEGERQGGANRPNAQTLAKLCALMVATSGSFPNQESWQICSQSVLNSIYSDPANPKDPLALRIAQLRDDLHGTSFQNRACAYYRFKRTERLAEILERKVQEGQPHGGPRTAILWDPRWTRSLLY